jgi:hypothetical protein
MRTFVGIALVVVFSAGTARAQPAAQLTPTESITYTGTITAIDSAKRQITTRGPAEPWQPAGAEGFLATWEAAPNISQAQIDALRVGQVLTVIYSDSIELRKKATGEPDHDTVDRATGIRTTTATITTIDPTARTVTFTGPTGRTHPRIVTNEAAMLRTIAVGDRVDVRWLETMQFATGAPVADWRAHRKTVGVQWGPDNQFAGHMIQQADGQTLSGVPIHFKETTYDEVYGRMFLFKLTFSYQTSERAEAVGNFVISRSGAQTVSIGTVGAANAQLNTTFDDYSYWGVEGGQRFFFEKRGKRARISPFAGYLIGLNRNDDIRADFVGVPAGSLPGYEAQDHKIFERSWAFSLGATGGVVVPVGPIEIIGEIGLRFLGGLSDVDWLVEEGLRDINTESERWSTPFLIGGRWRF